MSLFDTIKNLNNNEIDSFIENRLSQLKNDDKRRIGLDTRITVYDKLLTDKMKINAQGFQISDGESGKYAFISSYKMDDKKYYRYLIKEIKNNDDPYTSVFIATNNYLNVNTKNKEKTQKKRIFAYAVLSGFVNKTLSIKFFRNTRLSMCAEIAGVAHNMFRFLDIESDYVCGMLGGNYHAYNITYPEGRDKYAILFDATISNGPFPCMFYLDEENKNKLLGYEHTKLYAKDIAKAYDEVLNNTTVLRALKCDYLILKDGFCETTLEQEKIKKLKLEKGE